MKISSRIPRAAARALPRVLVLCAAALLAACASTTSPKLYDVLAIDKPPRTQKRVDPKGVRDMWNHFSRTAYHAPRASDFKRNGRDQQRIIENWGKPTWVRKPFKSLTNETVNEWVYLDGQQLFQFVDGNVVYEGPLTDFEQTLIKLGYPDNCIIDRRDNEDVLTTMYYQDFFKVNLEVFTFYNDNLIQSREGN